DQAALTLTVTPDHGSTGDALALGVSGGSGNGAVSFDIGSSTACTLGTGAQAGQLLRTHGTGSRAVPATKAGDASFKRATSNTATVTVSKAATNLATSATSGVYGGTANLAATLTSNGAPLAGKRVDFTLNGASVGHAATDGNGVAALSGVSLSGLNAGS